MFDKLIPKRFLDSLSEASDAASDPLSPMRWVVLDTETTGLSLWRDQLISVAAIAVHVQPGLTAGRICIRDRFEAVIRLPKIKHDKHNILIHHIGVQAQSVGEDQAQVLTRFGQWIGDAPLFAFHADFDQAMLTRAYKKVSLPVPRNRWIDVARLTNWAARDARHVSLDDRMTQFGLQCIARHQASGDTFVTAELLLMLLPVLRRSASDAAGLARLARDASPPA